MRHMERTLLFVSGCELNIASPVRDLGSCLSPCNQTCLSVPRGFSSNWRAWAPSLSSPEPASRAARRLLLLGSCCRALLAPGTQGRSGGRPQAYKPTTCSWHHSWQVISCARGQKLYSSPNEAFCPQSVVEQNPNVQNRVCCEFQRGFPGSGFVHVKWIESVVFSFTVKNGGPLQGWGHITYAIPRRLAGLGA